MHSTSIQNGDELPGWKPLTESVVKTRIKAAAEAVKKSQIDIKHCQELLEKGCDFCREKDSMLYQEAYQSQSTDYLQMEHLFQELSNLD